MSQLPLPYRFEVTSVPVSATEARRQISEVLSLWGLGDGSDESSSLILLAHEMIVNAIRFGGGGIVGISLELLPDGLRFDVYDGSEESPKIRPDGDEMQEELRESGRGMLLVDLLSTEWGCDRTARGKRVWALASVSATGSRQAFGSTRA